MDNETLDFDSSSSQDEVPIEDLSPASRVRLNLWIKNSIHRDLTDIADSEDATLVTVVRRALVKFVRDYKVTGKF
jgi:hypothetical protein